MVGGKLHHTPRYRQKVRFVPLGVSEPVWVDDRYFDLDYHLRHTAVPPPGAESQLRAMAARVFSQHLDRARPLWEIWMVEGLSDGRWALLSKVHHCMVDGVAATDLMSVMFDDGSVPPQADDVGARPRALGRRADRARRRPPRARPRDAGARRPASPFGAAPGRGPDDACRRRGGAGAASGDVIVDGADRSAPDLELGMRPLGDVKRVRAASAAPSTTSC